VKTLTDGEFRAAEKRVKERLKILVQHELGHASRSRLSELDRLAITAFGMKCYFLGHSELLGSEIQVSRPIASFKPLPDEGVIF